MRWWRFLIEQARRLDAALFPGSGSDPGEAGIRWFSLLYLSFLFVPLFAPSIAGRGVDWPATVMSITIFLPLYFTLLRYPDWRATAGLIAIVGLGCLLFPRNPFANTYIIYACAGAAYLPWSRAWPLATGALVAFALVVWTGDYPKSTAVFVIGLTALISGLVMSSNLIMRAKAAQQAKLRLSQEEVGRIAAMAERERIGRDLHDLLGHTLSVIAIKSELAARLADRDLAAARKEIEDVERIAREALGQVRGAIAGMRAVGLEAELANARLALAAVEVDFDYAGSHDPMPAEIETVLALALREAVTNVIRHARARRVEARLVHDGEQLAFTVRDDGRGGARLDGHGLSGMRERVEALGGSLTLVSLPGRGTELTIRLPWRPVSSGGNGRPPLRVVASRASAA